MNVFILILCFFLCLYTISSWNNFDFELGFSYWYLFFPIFISVLITDHFGTGIDLFRFHFQFWYRFRFLMVLTGIQNRYPISVSRPKFLVLCSSLNILFVGTWNFLSILLYFVKIWTSDAHKTLLWIYVQIFFNSFKFFNRA